MTKIIKKIHFKKIDQKKLLKNVLKYAISKPLRNVPKFAFEIHFLKKKIKKGQHLKKVELKINIFKISLNKYVLNNIFKQFMLRERFKK